MWISFDVALPRERKKKKKARTFYEENIPNFLPPNFPFSAFHFILFLINYLHTPINFTPSFGYTKRQSGVRVNVIKSGALHTKHIVAAFRFFGGLVD